MAAVLSSGIAKGQAAYVVDGLVKVTGSWQPDGSEASSATLAAAGNEVAAFQVALLGGASGAPAVTAEAPSLVNGSGQPLGGTVTLYQEAYQNVTTPSDGAGATGLWPDGLIPAVDEVAGEGRNAFPFDVPAGQARAIWVDVRVPGGAAPGTYAGTLTLSGGVAATIPVSLTVYPFELPATSTLRTAFNAFTPAICAYELGAQSACATPAGAQLLGRYVQLALDHRVTLANVTPAPPEASDLSPYAQALSPYVAGTGAGTPAGAKLTSLEYPLDPSAASYQAWAAALATESWSSLGFVWAADEPGAGASTWSGAQATLAAVQAAAPGLPTLVTTNIDDAEANGVVPSILVPVVNEMDDVSGRFAGDQRASYDSFVAGGGALWMYQSCMSHGCAFGGDPTQTGWPSYMIDASGVRNRAMQWADFAEQVTGELYYETVMAYELGNPWQGQYNFGGNGDGTLFYPGSPAVIGGQSEVPLPSIRLKEIRAGLEDYEYLALCAALGDPATAMAQARTVVPSVHAVNPDPNALRAARAALAQRILELLPQPAAAQEGATMLAPQTAEATASGAPVFSVSSDAPAAAAPTSSEGHGCATGTGDAAILALPALLLALARRRRSSSR
ncbi:MAG TPA: hypothetical protein VMB50_24950 [Myxococcales bacterium]|nr:hypothetical protein [Myxococcales bacterium]